MINIGLEIPVVWMIVETWELPPALILKEQTKSLQISHWLRSFLLIFHIDRCVLVIYIPWIFSTLKT